MTLETLVFRYVLFAIIATLANLAMQRLMLMADQTASLFALAVAMGTLTGLVLKYLLDKRWIFHDIGSGVVQHGRKFTLYTAMGIVTTTIFWGMETLFWLTWGTDAMRELGAVLGLAIGYTIKYNLDRRYVFTDATRAAA